ncbi:MAG: immune inhibitor A [Flavobacteriales bacterium]|nr:immune inhibitor A [Flavobacteriales bacterium]
MQYRLLSTLAFVFLFVSAFAQQADGYARVRVWTDGRAGTLADLAALGLAVDHGEVKVGAYITTDLSHAEIAVARSAGFTCEVLIPDVASYYRSRNTGGAAAQPRSSRELCHAPGTVAVPENFQLGSMGGYFTWEELIANLDAMHALFPGLISAKQAIGTTHEGRSLYMVRISNAPDVDQEKPEVLYDALHHAREPASLSQLIFYMWHLLESYGTDEEVTYLLNNLELYFVPCVNPDGYVYNQTTAPEGGGMWRKNRRVNGDGTFGVDLNRNYGQGWGTDDSGSSPITGSDVYRGPSAFSEPETQAMRDLCNARQFRMALNYHTFGNLLIYPWGYQPSFYTPDSAMFVEQGVVLTKENRYRFGTADQTVNYVVNGGSDDWMYGEQTTKDKIFSMTPEAGQQDEGFWPPDWRITEICQVNVGQNKRLAHLAAVHGQVDDRTSPIIAGNEGYVRFNTQRLGQEPGPLTVAVEGLENVSSVGAPITYTDLELLEVRTDSIAITLSPGLSSGAAFRYVLSLNNGLYTWRDTITRTAGAPVVVLVDQGNSMSGWQGTGWGISTSSFTSAPSCISNPPNGNYSDAVTQRITRTQPVDLTNASAAVLNFMAKWDMEAYYDQVQVLGSADGVNWTPLCGRYTRPGSIYQDEGQPVYDGQQPNWVHEEIDLGAFVGGPFRLRFELRSDFGGNYPGFRFDDLRITVSNGNSTSTIELNGTEPMLRLLPNPTAGQVWVSVGTTDTASLVLFSALGEVVFQRAVQGQQGSFQLDLSELAAGTYICKLIAGDRTIDAQRLVVLGY